MPGELAPTAPARPRWRRPVVVACCLLAAALAVLARGPQPDVGAAVLLAVAGVLLAAADFAEHRLPDAVLGPTAVALLVLLTAAALVAGAWPDLLRGLLAALACGAVYLVLAVARPTGLGLGDVKLGAVLGLWLGWLGWQAVIVGVLAGFVAGGVAGLVLIVSRRASRHSAIAFGPWLLLGAALATVLPPGALLG